MVFTDNEIRIAAQNWVKLTDAPNPNATSFAAGAMYILQKLNTLPAPAMVVEDKWIDVKDRLPEIIDDYGKDCSSNVLAICDGKLAVMAYVFADDGENAGYVWANCNGDIYGDAYFDDDYNVTHWMPLPNPPKQ